MVTRAQKQKQKKQKKKQKKQKQQASQQSNQMKDIQEQLKALTGSQAAQNLTPTPEQLAATRAQWQSGLDTAAGAGTSDIQRYFQNLGLDPAAYDADISSAISTARAGVPDLAPYGTAFTGLGPKLENELTNALRARSLRTARSLDPTGRVQSNLDDPIIAEILARERGKAERYSQNLLDRGVITGSGYQGIQGDLGKQSARAGGLLTSLGDTILGGGQSELDKIYNQAQGRAGGLVLGENFDRTGYETQINKSFDDFMNSLEGKFESQLPGDLFQTSGLGSIAGSAQGAQNTPYSRKALSGVFEDEEEERGLGDVF